MWGVFDRVVSVCILGCALWSMHVSETTSGGGFDAIHPADLASRIIM